MGQPMKKCKLLDFILSKCTGTIMCSLGASPHTRRNENDRNGGIWQSRISISLAVYVQRRVCFVNVQSSLHKNVIFSDETKESCFVVVFSVNVFAVVVFHVVHVVVVIDAVDTRNLPVVVQVVVVVVVIVDVDPRNLPLESGQNPVINK